MVHFIIDETKQRYNAPRNPDELEAIIKKISKVMINMEENLHIFDNEGNNNPEPYLPFNNYTHQDVEFNFDINMGVLVLYFDDEKINNSDIVECLTKELNYHRIINDKVPTDYGNAKNTNYVSIKSVPKLSCKQRALFTDLLILEKAYLYGTTKFLWYIKLCNKSNDYLKIYNYKQKYEFGAVNQKFLLKSISTIIYDNCNIFNVKNGHRQIDYPYIEQLNMYKENRIIKDPIYINSTNGLAIEILSYFSNMHNSIIYSKSCKEFPIVNMQQFKLKTINLHMEWNLQLNKNYEYTADESEMEYKGLANTYCYISHMPLYDYFYIIEVQKKTDATQPNLMLPISSIVYNSKHAKNIFKNYFEKSCDYIIVKTYLSYMHRTEYEAIMLIPDSKLEKPKRDLLLAISKYGIGYDPKRQEEFSLDPYSKTLYIGHNTIKDSHIMNYMHRSDIVLFKSSYGNYYYS